MKTLKHFIRNFHLFGIFKTKLCLFIALFFFYSLASYSNNNLIISHISKIKEENINVKITQIVYNPYAKKMDTTTHFVNIHNSNLDSFSYKNLTVSVLNNNRLSYIKSSDKHMIRYNQTKYTFDTSFYTHTLDQEDLRMNFEQYVFMLFKIGPFAKEILNKKLNYRLNKKSQVYETDFKLFGEKCRLSLDRKNSNIGMIEVKKLNYKAIYEFDNIQEINSLLPYSSNNTFWINKIAKVKQDNLNQSAYKDSILNNYSPSAYTTDYTLFCFWTETCEKKEDLIIHLAKEKNKLKKLGIELRMITYNSIERNEVLSKQYKRKLVFEQDTSYLHQYYKISQNPTFLLINTRGEVLYRSSGNKPDDYETLKKLIEEELAKK